MVNFFEKKKFIYILRTGYGYGTFTLTWQRFVRYLQLQIQLTTWDNFAVRECSFYSILSEILI
jgi:hypothetical protein